MRFNCNKRFVAVFCSAAAGLCPPGAAFAAGPPGAAEPVVRARWLMGTLCEARAFEPDGRSGVAGPALDAALDRIEAVEQALTTWRPDGELALVNEACAGGRGAGAAPIPLSDDLFRALAAARDWAARTGGLFDPATGAIGAAWGLQQGGREADPAELAEARAHAGWERFALDAEAHALRCAAGLRFDLGGLGKGFALDEAARVLRARGVAAALLDFGGQFLALGAPPGADGWPVAPGPGRAARPLRDQSLAVTGNAERGFATVQGRRGHVYDPRTARTVDRDDAVAVFARDATTADALSTALFVAGPRDAPALVPPGVEALFLEPSPTPDTQEKGKP